MILSNPTPVIVPTVGEKQFNDLWLYNIHIHAPSVESGCINIETLPYNSSLKEIGPSSYMVPLQTSDLWNAVNEVPEVAVAMSSIFAAIEPLRAWIASKEEQSAEN